MLLAYFIIIISIKMLRCIVQYWPDLTRSVAKGLMENILTLFPFTL